MLEVFELNTYGILYILSWDFFRRPNQFCFVPLLVRSFIHNYSLLVDCHIHIRRSFQDLLISKYFSSFHSLKLFLININLRPKWYLIIFVDVWINICLLFLFYYPGIGRHSISGVFSTPMFFGSFRLPYARDF